MNLNQATPFCGKAFTFTEELEEGTLQAHSYGNGRFIQGIPSEDCEVSFSLYKADAKSLSIQIYDGNLFQWLLTIPNLRDDLDKDSLSISMNALLPHYPDVRERFAQYEREGHSLDTLELFVRHFLREGSVFATLGIEHLHEEDILTELHFHDIQSQSRSISEDLDLLDEAIDKLQAEKIMELGPTLEVMESVPALSETQSQLQASIKRRDPIAVGKVLATYPTYIDTGSLFVAIFYYEPTVFRLLLKHGAEVDGAVFGEMPLCLAAEMGNMDAVRLLLHYGADREGLCLLGHKRPLSGAASAGHLEIVRYLVEKKGANVDGKNGMSPLSGALKHNHTHIAGYLLSAGADVPNLEDIDPPDIAEILRECGLDSDLTLHRTLLGKLLRLAASFGDINAVERLINAGAEVNPTTHDQPLCLAALHGHLEFVRLLVRAGSWVNPSRGCLPLCRAASHGHLEFVRLLVRAGAIVNPQDLGQFDRSPLAEAAMGEQAKVAHFLSTTGATLSSTRRVPAPSKV